MKKAAGAAFFGVQRPSGLCAREDSNLHPAIAGPGPQPGASTSSATGASGTASIERGGFSHPALMPSDRPLTVPNTCSNEGKDFDGHRAEADDSPAADLR